MDPLMVPSTVIATLCRPSPLNCGQTTLPLILVRPLSVEHVTVMMVADAVPAKAKVANTPISLLAERMGSPPIGIRSTLVSEVLVPQYSNSLSHTEGPINWEET